MSKLVRNPKSIEEDDAVESKGPNLILIYSFLLFAILAAMVFAGMVVWPFYARRGR